MAHVEVDKETGVVKMNKFVAVQDMGLVINPKTCKSQIFGAIIMGISTALFEQRIMDPSSGAFINAVLATTGSLTWVTSAKLSSRSMNPTRNDRGA